MRGRPRSRLRDDEAIPAGAREAAARNPGCRSSMSMASIEAAAAAAPDPFVPQIYRVEQVSRELADTVTLDLDAVGRSAAVVRAGPIQHALRLRRRRSGDQHERRPRRTTPSCTPFAMSAPSAARSPNSRPARSSDCAGHLGRAGRSRRPKDRDVVIVAGGLGLAPLRPAIYQILANRGRYGRVVISVWQPQSRGNALSPRA